MKAIKAWAVVVKKSDTIAEWEFLCTDDEIAISYLVMIDTPNAKRAKEGPERIQPVLIIPIKEELAGGAPAGEASADEASGGEQPAGEQAAGEAPADGASGDEVKAAEIVKASIDSFLKGMRLVLGQEEDSGLKPDSAVLLGPTQVLVYGDRGTHERAAAFLDALRDATADVLKAAGRELTAEQAEALKALQAATSKRWAAREKLHEERVAAMARAETFGALDQFGWQLLAAACRGEVDDEALTEIRIAWGRPELAGLVDSPAACVVMRTAWIIIEASRAVPEDETLRALAAEAEKLVALHAKTCAEALQEEPTNIGHYLSVLYARLALERAGEFGVETADGLVDRLTLLLMEERKEGPLVPIRQLAHMLLVPRPSGLPPWPSDAPTKVIQELRMSSDDLVVLAAMAARRIGNGAWLAFRGDMREVVTDNYLSGYAVIVVNRLANPKLPFAVNN